jgi:hypothetical protein
MKFRKKPVVIDAVLFDGENGAAILDWAETFVLTQSVLAIKLQAGEITIITLEGDMTASPGDWIIRGVQGEFYPCKPDIFATTYEPVAA